MDELDALWAFLVAAAIAFAVDAARRSRSPRRLGRGPPAARARPARQARAGARRAGDPRRGGRRGRALPARRARDARHPRRRDGDRAGRRRWTTPARAACTPLVKLAGQFGAAAIPVWCDVRVENVTLPFVDPLAARRLELPADADRDRRGDERRELHRRRRRAGRGRLHDRRGHVRGDRAVARPRWTPGCSPRSPPGAAVGFLWHNFHPASIFMGDAGSNLLGLLLACVAIQGVLKTAAVVALFFPLVILAVPAARRHLRGRQADQVRPAGLPGGPLALPPPLRAHRLLAAAHRALPVRLDAVAGGARAGDALRAVLGRRRHAQPRLDARDRWPSGWWRSRPASTS